jgi:hypothetical protein
MVSLIVTRTLYLVEDLLFWAVTDSTRDMALYLRVMLEHTKCTTLMEASLGWMGQMSDG